MNRREGVFILEKQVDLSKRLKPGARHLPLSTSTTSRKLMIKHGHLTGDQGPENMVAKQSLRLIIRKLDYFYRWGGEEFVLDSSGHLDGASR